MIDPFNEKGLGQQLTQAKIANTQASNAKLNSEANPTGAPKLTEGQSKDYNYYERGNAANGELAGNGAALTGAATGERNAWRGATDALIRGLPGGMGNSSVANSLVSNERLKAEQSGREFINAILREDSGAALTEPEIAEYGRTYLPQPGDSQEVLQQKANARTRALQGVRGGLGNVSGITSPINQGGSASASRGMPATGTVMQGHVFLGGDPASLPAGGNNNGRSLGNVSARSTAGARVPNGRIAAILDEFAGADGVVARLMGNAGKIAAAEGITSSLGLPGAGAAGVIYDIAKEKRLPLVEAAGKVLASQQFYDAMVAYAKTGGVSKTNVLAREKQLTRTMTYRKWESLLSSSARARIATVGTLVYLTGRARKPGSIELPPTNVNP